MSFKAEEPRKKQDPMGPLIGFIMLIVVGGFSILTSGPIVNWLETTQLSIGSLGQVLPLVFPAEWPPIVKQIIVALTLFLVVFTIAMIILFSLMKPARGELDVPIDQIRAQKGKPRR